MYDDELDRLLTPKRKNKLKKKSFVKAIVLYVIMTILCIWLKVWLGVLIFVGLTVVNVYFQKKSGGKQIDTDPIAQGLYFVRQSKRQSRQEKRENRQKVNEWYDKTMAMLNTDDIDEELENLSDEE